MTQGIRDFFNLPPLEDVLRDKGVELPSHYQPEEPQEMIDPALLTRLEAATNAAKDAANRLAAVDGRDHDDTMDEICKQTMKHAQDLVDLGFNVDHARAANFFAVAATMYDKAISAKVHKRDAQLKAMRMALDQRKVELEERRLSHDMGEQSAVDASMPAGAVVVEDRNAIIKRFLEEKKAGKLPE